MPAPSARPAAVSMDRPSRSLVARSALSAIGAGAVLLLTGCAAVSNLVAVATTPPAPAPAHLTGTPVPAAAGASAAVVTLAGPAPAAAAPALPPGSPPHFASVVKDAKKTEGLFTLWQRDE